MLTRRGIELNIKESKFTYDIEDMRLFFSSTYNLERFISNINEFIDIETLKLRNKYHLNISFKKILIIVLYKRIEKRGFYIVNTNTGREIKENTMFIVS